MSKRLAFIGAHSAGKDTLSHAAFAYLKTKKRTCYYISEVAEKALMRGMDINTPVGQMWLQGYQIKSEMEALAWDKREFIICNRGIIDSVAYSYRIDRLFQRRMERLALEYMQAFPYYKIFFLRPFNKIENDGLRDTDRDEQLKIDRFFEIFLNQFHIPYLELDAPTKEKRIKQLQRLLREHVM